MKKTRTLYQSLNICSLKTGAEREFFNPFHSFMVIFYSRQRYYISLFWVDATIHGSMFYFKRKFKKESFDFKFVRAFSWGKRQARRLTFLLFLVKFTRFCFVFRIFSLWGLLKGVVVLFFIFCCVYFELDWI